MSDEQVSNWVCEICGKVTWKYPCVHCGKDPDAFKKLKELCKRPMKMTEEEYMKMIEKE